MAELSDELDNLFNNATNGLIDKLRDEIAADTGDISDRADIYEKLAERILQKANEEVRKHIFILETN